jgi:hypothetical protein
VAESRSYTIPVDTWNDVYIRGEFPLSETAWDRMMVVLSAMRPGLVLEDEIIDAKIEDDDGDRCGWESQSPGWLPCDLPRGRENPHHLLSVLGASGVRLSHYEDWSPTDG